MDIVIRNTSAQPLYGQIYDQIKDQIVADTLRPGDPLPSIRALAKELRISVITTKRAYDELERDGFINTVAARGCFVAEANVARIREDRLRQLEGMLDNAVRLAASCGIGDDELLDMLKMFLRGE